MNEVEALYNKHLIVSDMMVQQSIYRIFTQIKKEGRWQSTGIVSLEASKVMDSLSHPLFILRKLFSINHTTGKLI